MVTIPWLIGTDDFPSPSLEDNDTRLSIIPMNISSDNQLVPYHQGLRELTPYWNRGLGSAPANSYPAARQDVLMPPSHSPGTNGYIPVQNSIYTSDRRIKMQEINHVGSLIDIYA